MAVSPARPFFIAGLAAVLLLPAAVADAKGTHLLGGSLSAGGGWTLSIYRQNVGAVKGICLDLANTRPDGREEGTATGCAAGSLKAAGGVLPLTSRGTAGDAVTSYIAAGIVPSRTHEVRITFTNGKHLKTLAKPGPKAWRHVLATDVRYYGVDVLPTTTASVRSVSAYDRAGRRIARNVVKR